MLGSRPIGTVKITRDPYRQTRARVMNEGPGTFKVLMANHRHPGTQKPRDRRQIRACAANALDSHLVIDDEALLRIGVLDTGRRQPVRGDWRAIRFELARSFWLRRPSTHFQCQVT